MSRIIITGVAGLLGAHLSRHLLNAGHEVVGIDDLSGGYREFIDPRVDFREFDVRAARPVDDLFSDFRPEYVYHFAALAAEGLSPFIRRLNYSQNLLSSANLINASIMHDVKKFVFASSMAVYGDQTAPFTEDMRPAPVDPYGIAKYAVEMDLKCANAQFGLNYTIIRPHNVIGVYQNIWDRYRNVVGIFIRQALANESLTVYGDGTQVRAFSDVEFYMKPFERVLSAPSGTVYNIGADMAWSINEVATIVATLSERILGWRPRIVYLEPRHEVHTAWCDHKLACEELGFDDRTEITKSILGMFLWARGIEPREVQKHAYEVTKDIYSYWK